MRSREGENTFLKLCLLGFVSFLLIVVFPSFNSSPNQSKIKQKTNSKLLIENYYPVKQVNSLKQDAYTEKNKRDKKKYNYQQKCYGMYEGAKYGSGYLEKSTDYFIHPNNKITKIYWTSYGNPPDSYRKPTCKISDDFVGVLNKTILTECPPRKIFTKYDTNAMQKEIFIAEEDITIKDAEKLRFLFITIANIPKKEQRFLVRYERERPCNGKRGWSSVTSKKLGTSVKNELRYWYKFDYSEYF